MIVMTPNRGNSSVLSCTKPLHLLLVLAQGYFRRAGNSDVGAIYASYNPPGNRAISENSNLASRVTGPLGIRTYMGFNEAIA